MKILKTAEQKNFRVFVESYTERELKELECSGFIEMLFGHYVVYASDCKDVKVKYNKEYGFYKNVVTHNSGLEITVEL